MNPKQFAPGGKIRKAEFTLREDNTLALRLTLDTGLRTLVFHDFIKHGGHRYCLFHSKTEITFVENTAVIRTAAVDPSQLNAPIPGLLVTYRFTFLPDQAAFHLSASYGSDIRVSDCTLKLMDVSWEDLEVQSFTGYEYDAEDKPFCHTFPLPTEKNPLAPSYEELMRIRPHVAWERMKTRPCTFQKAVAVNAANGYFAVIGGTPTYHVEAEYIAVFTEMGAFDGDLRYYSGKNSPGAWFLLETPEDFFATADALEARTPALPEHVFVPFPQKTVSLEAGALKLELVQDPGGVWVAPVYAGEAEDCQPCPLFAISLWDTQYARALNLDSGNTWDRVEILQRKDYVRVTLSDPENGRVTGITVVAEAFLSSEQNRISWKTRVVNRSDRWSVMKVTYPQCLAQGFDTIYNSSNSGTVKKRQTSRTCVYKGKYPTGTTQNMAYSALYNPVAMEEAEGSFNGLYMGIHDPDGVPKFMTSAAAAQSRCTLLSTECTATYQKHAGNSYTLPGFMVWQRFSGDWFDATEIYRDFVHTQSAWLHTLRGRPDSPQWFRENPVWIMHFMPNENPDANPFPITLREKYSDKDPRDWYRLAVKFRQEIGVPVGYHLYNWHWVPFNNDNPHYFPTHHDLKEGMRELKKAGIRVVPYMAGYSWDMCDRRGGDYRFQQEALPATAKDVKGEPIFTSYASTEPTGQAVRFARMCPTTTTWKNEVRQVVRKLYTDFGMDGIYLDVVSTAYEQCCDETHLHEPGHGSFWRKGYEELIAGLRADAPAEFAMVSESTSEVYSGSLDGMLSWVWVQINGVPAFPRVYGGRTGIFGRVITPNKRDDNAYFRYNIAEALVYGQQLGWVHPEVVDDPVQFPFLKKMAKLRWDNAEFFTEAEMLRPPVIEGRMELLNCEAFLRGQIWNHEKLVMAGAWEDTAGVRKLFVINAGETEAEVTLSVFEKEYALPETVGGFQLCEGLTLLGEETENGVRKLRCRIAPEGFGVLTWNR